MIKYVGKILLANSKRLLKNCKQTNPVQWQKKSKSWILKYYKARDAVMLNEDKFSRPRPRPKTNLWGRGRGRGQFSESIDNVQEIIISMQTISHHFNLLSLLSS